MWPFTRKKWCDESGCEIDLDELKDLRESSPVKKYVSLVLFDMAQHGPLEIEITTAHPPPWPPHYDLEELPPTHEIINRLKVMCQLDPLSYPDGKEGTIQMMFYEASGVGERDAIVHARFRDDGHDNSVHLSMELRPLKHPNSCRPIPLTAETRRRLDALFTDRQRWLATKLLVEECGRSLPFADNMDPAALERIRIAALKVSDGRIDLLNEAVKLANTDWRDLLVAAGFETDPTAHLRWMPHEKNN